MDFQQNAALYDEGDSVQTKLICLAAVGMLLTLFSPGDAVAYSRICRPWAENRTSDLVFDINPDGFEKFGYDRQNVRRQINLAASEWSVRGGLPFRIHFGSFTSATTATTGRVLFKALDVDPVTPSAWFGLQGDCTATQTIVLYARHYMHSVGLYDQGLGRSHLYGRALQLFGLVLGFGSESTVPSVMNSANFPYELSHDDILGILVGTCSVGSCTGCTGTDCSYDYRTTTTLKTLLSTDTGTTWNEGPTGFVNIGDPTNFEADISYGKDGAGAGLWVSSYVKSTDTTFESIWIAHSASGASWTKYSLNSRTENSPSLAFSDDPDRWLVAWQRYSGSAGSERTLFFRSSTNATSSTSWSGETEVVLDDSTKPQSISRPDIAYAPSAGRFVMAWVERSSNFETEVRVASSPTTGTISFGHVDSLGQFSVRGLTIGCAAGVGLSATSDECLAAWPHHSAREYINHALAWTDPDYDGTPKVADPDATVEYTMNPVGVAVQPDTVNGGVDQGMVMFRGAVSPFNPYVMKKATASQVTSTFPASTALTGVSGLWTGPSLAFGQTNKWAAVYAR